MVSPYKIADFIKVALDFYVRENNFLRIENNGWLKWIGSKFASKDLFNPESEELDEGRIKKWPQIKGIQLNQFRSYTDCCQYRH